MPPKPKPKETPTSTKATTPERASSILKPKPKEAPKNTKATTAPKPTPKESPTKTKTTTTEKEPRPKEKASSAPKPKPKESPAPKARPGKPEEVKEKETSAQDSKTTNANRNSKTHREMKWPTTEEEFAKQFWEHMRWGNHLIDKLNAGNHPHLIRRSQAVHVYAIVLNRAPSIEFNDPIVRLLKVGSTEIDTQETSKQNRMNAVKKLTIANLGDDIDISVLFVAALSANETKPLKEVEDKVRNHVGTAVERNVAKECNLPVHTEWAVTTQSYIDKVLKADDKEHLTTNDVLGISEFVGATLEGPATSKEELQQLVYKPVQVEEAGNEG